MKTEIYLCQDEEDSTPFLSHDPSYGDTFEKLTDSSRTTLEDLADLCDQESESSNNHDYVGTHRILAALLYQQVGREQATKILFEIAQFGGLDGMGGVGGKADAFADFGIKDCWSDWKLEEGSNHE